MTRPRFLADEDLRHGIVLAVRWLEPLLQIITVSRHGVAGFGGHRHLGIRGESGLARAVSRCQHDACRCRAPRGGRTANAGSLPDFPKSVNDGCRRQPATDLVGLHARRMARSNRLSAALKHLVAAISQIQSVTVAFKRRFDSVSPCRNQTPPGSSSAHVVSMAFRGTIRATSCGVLVRTAGIGGRR